MKKFFLVLLMLSIIITTNYSSSYAYSSNVSSSKFRIVSFSKSSSGQVLKRSTIRSNNSKSEDNIITGIKKFENTVDSNLYFNYSKALSIANNDPHLKLVSSLNKTIKKRHPDVDGITNEIMYLITQKLGTSIPAHELNFYRNAVYEEIRLAFSNLKKSSSGNFIFSSKKSYSKNNYYNLFFAFENDSQLTLIPVGLNVNVYKKDKRVFGIRVSKKREYKATVQGLKVVYSSTPIKKRPVRRQPIRRQPIRRQPIRRQPISSQPIRRQPVPRRYAPHEYLDNYTYRM
ncbi:hypothetical protein [Vallitalea guaymasensis]|uniref:Uncharacterized protein n=1 Tax=Vallitalea guaymasensis TaxID=1185412 RepID=A0A8J8SE71_9FIRM|nr:hypothetical protein [Vallitalea guaymasensis]QUH31628.1 hypothetical protein HYG85_22935 [Vallitalea guaymasensis]